MIKKIFVIISVLFVLPVCVFSFELGLIGGTINKPTESIYGISGTSGFIIPLLKFEVEYYNLAKRKWEAVTGGVKLRKKFGKFAPYAVVGVGAEFPNLTFHTSQYETFLFVGGGVHYHFAGFFSLRADIRFQNFSEKNKTRLSVGIFAHI